MSTPHRENFPHHAEGRDTERNPHIETVPAHRKKLTRTSPLHQRASATSWIEGCLPHDGCRSRSRITQRMRANVTAKLYIQNPSVMTNIAVTIVVAIFGD